MQPPIAPARRPRHTCWSAPSPAPQARALTNVLRRDQLDLVALAAELQPDRSAIFRVGVGSEAVNQGNPPVFAELSGTALGSQGGGLPYRPNAKVGWCCTQPQDVDAAAGFRSAKWAVSRGSSRRDSSPLLFVGVGTALFFLPLTCVRERSAERRYVLVCTLRCACLAGTPPRGAPPVASFHPGTVSSVRTGDFHLRDPGGFRRPSSEPYRPSFEGSPSF